MIEGMAQTAGAICVAGGRRRQGEARLFPHHRQGQIPQAGRAGRRARISHDQEGAAQDDVVVSRRGQGRGRTRRRGGSRRHADRGVSRCWRSIPRRESRPSAVIGADVEIGPYCVIGPNVAIGDGCKLVAHVHHCRATPRSAPARSIYPFASLGTPPQSVHYQGEADAARRSATTARSARASRSTLGTAKGGGITTVGDDCLPDGRRACRRTTATSATMSCSPTMRRSAATVEIGDYVFLGGHCAVHQFTRHRRERDDRRAIRRCARTSSRTAIVLLSGGAARRHQRGRDAAARRSSASRHRAVRARLRDAVRRRGRIRRRASTRSPPSYAGDAAGRRRSSRSCAAAKRPVMMTRLRGACRRFE